MYSDIESFSSDERGHARKTNKPMMEKKRRARINHCLSELKEILICDKHASAGHAKWEKADILEMTVDYLKKLRALRGHTPTFNVAATLEDTLSTHGVKECDSTPTSAVSSPSSTESTSEGPTAAKRRKTTAVPSPSNTEESRSLAPAPSSPTPSSLTTLTPTRIPPTVMAPNLRPPPPNFSFMAQHLLALQYQQNLKMAAIAPGMVSAITPVHPFAAMTAIPWRTM